MEFPHIGQHCSEKTCNRLDFLPVKCDSCNQDFCSFHYNYDSHSCTGSRRNDVQVPVCPLCGEPVPTAPGVAPDLTVGRHIDQQCQSDTKKIFTNRCTYKNCKKKELIPVTCSLCKQNYCLRHRHTTDHECKALGNAAAASTSSSAQNVFKKDSNNEVDKQMMANAAEYRRANKPTSLFNAKPKSSVVAARAAAATAATAQTSNVRVQNLQGNMTEDEALARALALSIMELDESADRNRRNEAATGAAAAVPPVGGQRQTKDKCSLS